ncbi:DUF4870 domain-containing protein [Chitinophaga qingshengii]|uniref:DUF4870 domain-containing protein n=1 Tax=Chitinophaga qingshengii TaxID=1569794 RepID=A0ABR7TU35_9BACT|nr:DUF4870 domain-containing protein [Chitinophaga qingshengii]MBC9933133.1 DUF4870 domain-containing protein [Chitinophaga qingshengii]
MNNKTLSIVSYITLIGWLIAYFSGKEKADDLLKYHLRQSLGLVIIGAIVGILLNVVLWIIPALSFLTYIGLVILALMIIGMINAANEAKKPLPVIGGLFEDKFAFIG